MALLPMTMREKSIWLLLHQMGAIRTYYIDLLILQHITDGWDRKRALWELRKDVIMGLETGYDQYCTSPFDLSDRDRDYMFDLAIKLLRFFDRVPTY